MEALQNQIFFHIIFDDLAKSQRTDGFVKSSPAKAGLGAQKLRSEAHFQVRRNDEVAAQRRRRTFYEAITFLSFSNSRREQAKPSYF
jgi:hypothetical protein